MLATIFFTACNSQNIKCVRYIDYDNTVNYAYSYNAYKVEKILIVDEFNNILEDISEHISKYSYYFNPSNNIGSVYRIKNLQQLDLDIDYEIMNNCCYSNKYDCIIFVNFYFRKKSKSNLISISYKDNIATITYPTTKGLPLSNSYNMIYNSISANKMYLLIEYFH